MISGEGSLVMRRVAQLTISGILLLGLGGSTRADIIDHQHLSQIRTDLVVLTARLKAAQIDPEPLLDKAREGVVKRVPASRILQVLRQLAGHLQDGRRALARLYGHRLPRGLLSAWGAARLAGVDAALLQRVLAKLSGAARKRWAVRMVDTVTDLSSRGYQVSEIGPVVEGLVRHRRYRQVLRLRATLEGIARRHGLNRLQSARVLHRALRQRGTMRAALRHLQRHLPGAASGRHGHQGSKKPK